METLTEFPITARKSTHEWEILTDGKVYKLVVNQDIASIRGFRSSFGAQCRERGLDYRTTVIDKGEAVVVQAIHKPPTISKADKAA